MAATRVAPQRTTRTLKSLKEERSLIRTNSVCKTERTLSRLDLITQEISTLLSSVDNPPKKVVKALKVPVKHKASALGRRETIGSDILLKKATAISNGLEKKRKKFSVNLCEGTDISHSKISTLSESMTSAHSSVRRKRTLLRTPSVLKSTSSSLTPKASISRPSKATYTSSPFIFGLTSVKKKLLVDQAAELLTTLRRRSPVSPATRIPCEIKLSRQAKATIDSQDLSKSRLPKPRLE
jgi:hypothetical protein